MADPVSLAVIGLVGAGISAGGTAMSYEAKASNAAYQAQVAANNATTAKINAGLDIQQGEVGAFDQGLKTRAIVGATKAGEAASGVDVNSGSFVRARAGEAAAGLTDALTIRSNAAKKAWADETQATGYTAESGLLKDESSQASIAGPIAATGSLLSGASSVGSGYYKYMQG